MADREVEIKIKTIGDLRAAEANKKAVEAAIEQAKKAGVETKKHEAALNALNSALKQEEAQQIKKVRALTNAIEETRRAGIATKELEKELEKVTQSLDKEIAAQLKAERSTAILKEQQKRLAQEQNAGGEATNLLASRFPLLGRAIAALKNPLGATIALLAGLAIGAKKAVSAFAEQEEKLIKLDAALAQNALLTDRNRESYQKLASELQATTGVADDKWIQVLTKLTQFGSRPETIGMDVDAVKNLAGVLGGGEGSLVNAAVLVGKVIQGNTAALSEYGIQADQTLPKAEQIADVLNKIAAAGGGQLEANLDSLGGQTRQLVNHMGDLMEAVGGLLDRAYPIRAVIGAASEAFRFWAEALDVGVAASARLENKTDSLSKKFMDQKRATEEAKKTLEQLGAAAQRAARDTDRLTQAQAEQAAQADRMADLEMALAIENLRGQNLDPETELRAEAQIRQSFAQAGREREIAFEETQQRRASNRIEMRGTEAEADDLAVANAENALQQLRSLESARSTYERLQEQFDKLTDQMESGEIIFNPEIWDDLRRIGARLSRARESFLEQYEATAPELRASGRTSATAEVDLQTARQAREENNARRAEANQADRELLEASRRRVQSTRDAGALEDRLATAQTQNALSDVAQERNRDRMDARNQIRDAMDPAGAAARAARRTAQDLRRRAGRSAPDPSAASAAAQAAIEAATGGRGIRSGFDAVTPEAVPVMPSVPAPSNLEIPQVPLNAIPEAVPPGGATPAAPISTDQAQTAVQQGNARANSAINQLGSAIEVAFNGQATRLEAIAGRVSMLESQQRAGRV